MLRIIRPLSVSALLLLTTVRIHCAETIAVPAPGLLNDDLLWIASMTKSMTATAFMMLVDEGKAPDCGAAISAPLSAHVYRRDSDSQTPPRNSE